MNEPWLLFPQPDEDNDDGSDPFSGSLASHLSLDPQTLERLRSAIQYRRNVPFGMHPWSDIDPPVRLVTNAAMRAGWSTPLLPTKYEAPVAAADPVVGEDGEISSVAQQAENGSASPQATPVDREDADMDTATRANTAAAIREAPPQSVRDDLEPLPMLNTSVATPIFDSTPLRRMIAVSSQRNVAAKRLNPTPFPIDPTDGMRAGPTLERLRLSDPDFAVKERVDADRARRKQELDQIIAQANQPKMVAVDPQKEKAASYSRLRSKNNLEMALLGPFAGPGLVTRAFGGDENAVAAGNEFGAGLFGLGVMGAGIPARGGYPFATATAYEQPIIDSARVSTVSSFGRGNAVDLAKSQLRSSAARLDTLSGKSAASVNNVESSLAESTQPGEFSIIDWSRYPNNIPKPMGTCRVVEGDEYESALSAKEAANAALRRKLNLVGQPVDIHEILPVKFSGNPSDLENKIILPRNVHQQQVTPWWSRLLRDINK